MNWRYIMSRVLAAVLITLILGFLHKAHAGLINLSNAEYAPSKPSTFSHDGDVWQYNPKTGTSTTVSPEMTAMDDFRLPTSSGRVPVTIEQRAPINLPRVGLATVNLLKRGIPFVGTAVALGEFVCAVTYICQKTDGTPEYRPQNTTVSTGSYCASGNNDHCYASRDIACQHSCGLQYSNNLDFADPACTAASFDPNGASGGCNANGGPLGGPFYVVRQTTCPDGYTLQSDGTTCLAGTPQNPVPVNETQWQQAQTLLASMDAAQKLVDAGQPLPVDAPRVTSTTNTPLSSSTTTLRDQTGTATGTETKTVTAKVEPAPTGSPASTANYTETTVTTVNNITNNTTNSTTTVTSPPDNATKDPEYDIDNVADSDLTHHDIENTFSPQSFGEGSCPADPIVNYSHGSITLPFHVACDFASMIRSIILILCSLSAAYIIAETKYD